MSQDARKGGQRGSYGRKSPSGFQGENPMNGLGPHRNQICTQSAGDKLREPLRLRSTPLKTSYLFKSLDPL